MSDVDRLLDLFDKGKLLRPGNALPNVVDLADAVARISGVEDAPGTDGVSAIQTLIGCPDHLVFVIADGMGMNFVDRMDPGAFIASHLATELRTVFPSTTPTVMTSFATGRWPGQHAVVGWHTYLPALDDVSIIIRYQRAAGEKPLAALEIAPERMYPIPTQLGRLGRDSLFLQPEAIATTVYSRYYTGGAATLGYNTLGAAHDVISKRLARAERPTFTYLYTFEVDKAAHEHGAYHATTWARVGELDAFLQRLAESLLGNARLVVTADHGHLEAHKGAAYSIASLDDELLKLSTRKPSGDIRVMYLTVPEEAMARFEELFQSRFGDDFLVLTLDDVESLELLGPGPISVESRARIGNLICLSTGAATLDFRKALGEKDKPPSVSNHSGLTPDEMRIPLVIV